MPSVWRIMALLSGMSLWTGITMLAALAELELAVDGFFTVPVI